MNGCYVPKASKLTPPPDNPYESPESTQAGHFRLDKRWPYLCLPIAIPPVIYIIARQFIEPGGRPPYLAFVSLGSIIPAWAWAYSMVERFKVRSFWRNYLLTCFVFALILAASFAAPRLFGQALSFN